MKKTLAVILALMLAATALLSLSGCGENALPLSDRYFDVTEFGDGGNDWTAVILDACEKTKEAVGIQRNIYFPKGEYRVASRLLIPTGVTLIFGKGAVVRVADGGAFMMNGRGVIAEKKQIFIVEEGGRLGGFTQVGAGYPEWFGAVTGDGKDDSDAFTAALGLFANVTLSEGVYDLDKSVDMAPVSKGTQSLVVEGAGADKTTLRVASEQKGLFYNAENVVLQCIDIRNIGFSEKEGGRTAFAVSVCGGGAGAKCVIDNCSFAGFNTAFYTESSGFCHFLRCYAENNGVVCEIGGGSMFLFYKYDKGKNNGIFIKCDIPPNGGYSNGIDIVGCETEGSEQYDVYIKDNQAVFIAECAFTEGKGEASVCLVNVSDYRLTSTKITSAESGRKGLYCKNSHSGYIYDCDFENNGTAVYFDGPPSWRAMAFISENRFKGSGTADIYLYHSNDVKIVGNDFQKAFDHKQNYEIVFEKKTKNVVIADNRFASASTSFNGGGFSNVLEYDNVFAS